MINPPFNLNPDAAQDPRLQALMAMIAQNQAQPAPGGAPSTMSAIQPASGPAPIAPAAATPAPSGPHPGVLGFLARLGNGLLGVPPDASPDVQRAARAQSLMRTGLAMMQGSYGVPGQPKPSFGRTLPGALMAGQAGAQEVVQAQPDQEAQNILKSINWTDTSPTGLQGAALGLLHVGKVKEAGVIIDLLRETNAKQTAAHNNPTINVRQADGRTQVMTTNAQGVVVPRLDAEGKPVFSDEKLSESAPAHFPNAAGQEMQWDAATHSWVDSGQKAPPRLVTRLEAVSDAAADRLREVVGVIGDNIESPSAGDAFWQHIVQRYPQGAALNAWISDHAKENQMIARNIGFAIMASQGQTGRGPAAIQAAEMRGAEYTNQVGDSAHMILQRARMRRSLYRSMRVGPMRQAIAANAAVGMGGDDDGTGIGATGAASNVNSTKVGGH